MHDAPFLHTNSFSLHSWLSPFKMYYDGTSDQKYKFVVTPKLEENERIYSYEPACITRLPFSQHRVPFEGNFCGSQLFIPHTKPPLQS